ncbi:tolloid-like protein 2 [Orbicella faveolata]|uniref:tolloid-like protein 2 n=1 Tax=Orbicella faveolata TaxID=48498 RepID=UPI0009E3ABBE|nr:tolloid-like protein 2 [Orbicella faveolata]
MNLYSCHKLAQCVNIPGYYDCRCAAGKGGDGRQHCGEPEVNSTSTCPNKTVELTTIDGIIQSNKRGERYENNMDCQWNITSNAWVELTFDRFDTELYDDYLTVYDGTSLSSPEIGKFSGSTRPLPLISLSKNLYVRFTTDAAQNKQYKGFRAKYRGKMCCNLTEKYMSKIAKHF